MLKFVVAVGAMAIVLAACGSTDSGESEAAAPAPDVATTSTAAPAVPDDTPDGDAPDGDSSVTVPADVCELFEGIDPVALINTAAGAFVGSDDECSVPAADPLEFAQANITIGDAPAMLVIRNNYEGPLYECDVVDVDGLGDEAFTCLGGVASSSVVFAAGEYLVIFTAGNNVAGPPSDSIMMDAAESIYASMTS